MGDNEQAQKILQQLLEQHPDDEAIGEAIDQLSDEPLSAKGKNKAVELNRRGKDLLGSQQYSEAIALFGEALRHYPNNIAVKLNLLLAMVRHMNTSGANAALLWRCEKIINSVDTLKDEHPLRERFQLLWEHVENLQEQLLEEDANDGLAIVVGPTIAAAGLVGTRHKKLVEHAAQHARRVDRNHAHRHRCAATAICHTARRSGAYQQCADLLARPISAARTSIAAANKGSSGHRFSRRANRRK
jgi:tetratricopeptide (TPR) repeat protein